MRFTKAPVILLTVGALALAACTNPQTGERSRAREGALAGAFLGGLFGSRSKGGNRAAKTAAGAVVGAAVGTAIGAALDAQAEQLRNEFSDGRIDVINTGDALLVRMPQDILFDFDSAEVRPGLRSDLFVLARSLNDYPDTTVEVVGHTDNTGTAAYNQDLSERRARSVKSVLEQGGVAPSRILAFGRGEDDPIADNLTPEGRARNRRVDITIRPNNV